MFRYAVRRLVTSIITLFFVITITFFLMQLVPGNPFMDDKTSPEMQEKMMARYGYDQPLPVQYVRYMSGLVRGDFGYSLKVSLGKPITEFFVERMPVSLKLGFIALAISLVLGIPLGAAAAVKHDSIFDRCFLFFASFFISIPSFITTVALMLIFGLWLKILPIAYLDSWKSYIMPIAAMALGNTFGTARLTRTSMLDVMGQDYIKTARAKGLPKRQIIFKHALRNAILPVVTTLGPTIAGILTGSLVVEQVFGIKGIGQLFTGSVQGRDYPLIMATTMLFATLLIFCNFLVDLAYSLVDPRIKM